MLGVVVVDPDGLLAAPVPNKGFCSAGLDAVFPNRPPVVPEEVDALPMFPPRFPKEKLGVPVDELPKTLVEVVGVEEPNNEPVLGAVDVVALLDCAPELALLPKSDMMSVLFAR